ncbi:MAG: hypothetical protein Q6J46_12265, partial [Thermostichus sp. DG02_2_bins_29]
KVKTSLSVEGIWFSSRMRMQIAVFHPQGLLEAIRFNHCCRAELMGKTYILSLLGVGKASHKTGKAFYQFFISL